jgi:tetratricopeptide (TPR) repeat protein
MSQHRTSRTAPSQVFGSGRLAIVLATLALIGGCQPQGDHTAAGRQYLEGGQYREAIIEFKNAVQAEPGSASARVHLADALERTHDLAGAEQQLRKAVEANGPENLVLRIASIQLDRTEFDKLIREFKDRRLADKPDDSRLRALVAIAYVGQKQPARAQEQLQGVVDTPEVTLARAQLLAATGQVPQALALLTALADQAQGDTQMPWWLLRATARLAGAAGDASRSLESIRQAHAAAPWNWGVTGEYAEALVNAGKTDEAAAVRDQLRKQAPNYFWTHYLDALLFARAGRVDESHAAALRALVMSPHHLPVGLLAASAELSKGDLLLADKRLQTLAQEHPRSLPALRMLVQSKVRSRKPDEAMAAIGRGLLIAPQDVELLTMKADIEWTRGERKAAVATLTGLAAARPGHVDVMLSLAEARAGIGEKMQAARLLDEAAARSGQDAGLRGRVVGSALRLGYLDQARRLADQGVALLPDAAQARLTLAAVQAAQRDVAAAWATTVAVLDREPGHAAALIALAPMAQTPAQQDELRARHAKAMQTGPASAPVILQYAALQRSVPGAGAAGVASGAGGAGGASGAGTGETPLAILQRGLAALPASLPLREAVVEEQFRAGQHDLALATARTGAALDDAPAQALALQASVHERLGQIEPALELYRKLQASQPQRPEWRFRLARLDAAAGRRTEAATLLRALLKERPFDATIYLELADLALPQNPDEALSIARQMGERDELRGAALLLQGDVLARTGKTEAALVQFGKASRLGMEPAATLRAVRTLDAAGRTAAADDELAGAMKRFRGNPAVLGFAAQRALDAGRHAQAVTVLQQLAGAAPNNPMVLNDLAWAQVLAGSADALANSRRASAALPNNANVLDTLGMALAQAGRHDEAIDSLRAATNLAPLAVQPRLHLSRQLLAAGDRAGARAALQAVPAARLDDSQKATYAQLMGALGNS